MPLKFKIVFYNLMIFLVIFDFIYLFVWIFSIEMNSLKGLVVAGVSALIMPWARPTGQANGRKVAIRSLAYIVYKNISEKRRNNNPIR